MNYQEFRDNVKDYITNQMEPNKKVILQPVLKNNGINYDGLVIIDPEINITPTIYLNPYYHRYLSGVTIEDIYDDILNTYYENMPKEDFDISLFCDFEKAKTKIAMKLVNKEKNQEILQDVPHVDFQDLALIFVCMIRNIINDELGTILIHNHHLKLWNITDETLYQIALENAPSLLPYKFDDMEELLQHLIDPPLPFLEELNLFVLTNAAKVHGATSIVYPGVLKEISRKFNDDLIIIPSSVHEVILVPASSLLEKYTFDELSDMINEVNETQLTDDEILSNHAYLYKKDNDIILSEF